MITVRFSRNNKQSLFNIVSTKHLGVNKMADKKADLAGPGIGDYDELEKTLPQDYNSLLSPKETQIAT